MKHLAIAATLLSASIAADAQDVAKKYEIDVTDFTELKLTGNVGVDYVCNPDSAGKAVFMATPAQASLIVLDNNGKGRLSVERSKAEGENPSQPLPRVTVFSRFLTKVENSSDSLLRVRSIAPTAIVKAKLVGNGGIAIHGLNTSTTEASITTGHGHIMLQGTTANAKYWLMGTGSIQADELTAPEVRCKLVGTGYIECGPGLERLNVVGAGTGKIYYRGTPEIKNRAVSIKLEQMK